MKKTIEERIAAKRERQAQLAAQLAALEGRQKAADRKRDTRRKIVIGAAVLVEMELRPAVASYVREMLDKAVTRPQDREVIADLLSPPKPNAPPSSVAEAINHAVSPQSALSEIIAGADDDDRDGKPPLRVIGKTG